MFFIARKLAWTSQVTSQVTCEVTCEVVKPSNQTIQTENPCQTSFSRLIPGCLVWVQWLDSSIVKLPDAD